MWFIYFELNFHLSAPFYADFVLMSWIFKEQEGFFYGKQEHEPPLFSAGICESWATCYRGRLTACAPPQTQAFFLVLVCLLCICGQQLAFSSVILSFSSHSQQLSFLKKRLPVQPLVEEADEARYPGNKLTSMSTPRHSSSPMAWWSICDIHHILNYPGRVYFQSGD